MKQFRPVVFSVLMSVPMLAALADPSSAAQALSATASDAVAGSGTLVSGAALVAGSVTVLAVVAAGNVIRIVVQDGATLALRTIEVGADVLGTGALAVGTALQIVACGTGYGIFAGTTLVAYLVNDTGRALVHSSRLTPG